MTRFLATVRHCTLAVILTLALSQVALIPGADTLNAQGLTVTAGEQGPRYFYEPATLTLPAGQVSVTVANSGGRSHNFVIDEFKVHSPDIERGRTAQVAFTATPGTYTYYCDLPGHFDRGMKGTLTVTAGAQQQSTTAPAAPATTAPAATTAATAVTAAQATTGTGAQASPTVLATRPAATAPAAATVATSSGVTTTNTSAAKGSGGGGMRITLLFISLAIHIPAAILWLGLALYDLIVVAVPFLTPAQRGGLLRRPRWLVVTLIPIILVTGIYQTIYNPFGTLTNFASLERLRAETAYGFALFLKHGFVIASWALTLALTFWLAPRLVAFADDTSEAAATPPQLPRLAAWANFLACAALVLCVTVMVFQLH